MMVHEAPSFIVMRVGFLVFGGGVACEKRRGLCEEGRGLCEEERGLGEESWTQRRRGGVYV